MVSGDKKGAQETQQNFLKQCPIVSQVTSAVQVIQHDQKSALNTQKEFLNAMSSVIDGLPLIGHTKGG